MFNWLKNQTARAGFVVALVAVSLAYAATGTIWTLTGKGSRRNTVEFSIESPTVGTAAKFLPGTDNTNALGSSTLRFSDVQTVLATIGGATTISGLLTASTTTLTGGFAPWGYPAPDAGLIPTTTGQIVRNTTSGGFCYSTGTAASSWVLLTSSTTACQN
jgi:hypothetical protein